MKLSYTPRKQGFTLIELLVVVLIIAVLAAIALPQYQKAVEKAKATEAITLLKTVYKSAQLYYLEHGTWPTSFAVLDDAPIPWTGKTKWETLGHTKDSHSNKDWSINLHNNTNYQIYGIGIGRITGPYKGTGFYIFNANDYTIQPHQIYCVERVSAGITFSGKAGSYCKDLFHGSLVTTSSVRYYAMP